MASLTEFERVNSFVDNFITDVILISSITFCNCQSSTPFVPIYVFLAAILNRYSPPKGGLNNYVYALIRIATAGFLCFHQLDQQARDYYCSVSPLSMDVLLNNVGLLLLFSWIFLKFRPCISNINLKPKHQKFVIPKDLTFADITL